MNDDDDDLTRRLEAWAVITDPTVDPITAAEVASATAAGATPSRHRRLMAVAAVVALIGIIAAVAVALTQADDPTPDVVTSGGEEEESPDGPRTQVVVIADVDDGDTPRTHRFAIESRCADRAACIPRDALAAGPLHPGTSLVADQPLPEGGWALRYESDTCGDPCGPLDETGALEAGGDHPLTCFVDLPAATPRIVVRVTDPADGIPTCGLDPSVTEPELTVPPAWSVRDPLPWSCGTGAWDRVRLDGPRDRGGSDAALACFAAAVEEGTPVELPTSLGAIGRVDGLRESWWRVGAAGPGDRAIEVLSEPGGTGSPWLRTWCRDVEVGAMGTLGWDVATLVDCTAEDPLSLDLPPLAEGSTGSTAPEPTTTEAMPLPPGPVDVVLDVNGLPSFTNGGVRRWSISIVGTEMASGALTEIGGMADSGIPPDVQLIGDDVAYVDEKAFSVTVDDYDCFAEPPCRGDEVGPRPGARADGSCTAEAPIPRTGSVLVATFRGGSCEARWADAVPALTVPPAWSLRPPDTRCADLDDYESARWATCLIDVLNGGEGAAEWTTYGDGLRTTYLVAPGSVTVVRTWRDQWVAHWTVQTCTGLDLWPDGRDVDPTGCGAEEELSLEPG